MHYHQTARTTFQWAGKILLSGVVFACGLVAARLLFHKLGVQPPRMPGQVPESEAVYYLLVGSVVLAAGTAPAARCIRNGITSRWLVLTLFLCTGFALSTTIETAIFSDVQGVLLMVPVLLIPCSMMALTHSLLLRRQPGPRDAPSPVLFPHSPWETAWRLTAAVAAFPLVYFFFGILVSPIVAPYYAEGVSGLALPATGTLVGTQFLRSVLHLAVALVIMQHWAASKGRYIAALTAALFVFVMAYDTVLAFRVPWVLIAVHSLEVLADSLVYAWLLARLFFHSAIQPQDQTL